MWVTIDDWKEEFDEPPFDPDKWGVYVDWLEDQPATPPPTLYIARAYTGFWAAVRAAQWAPDFNALAGRREPSYWWLLEGAEYDAAPSCFLPQRLFRPLAHGDTWEGSWVNASFVIYGKGWYSKKLAWQGLRSAWLRLMSPQEGILTFDL